VWSANPRHTVLYVGGPGSVGTGPTPLSVLEGTTFVVSSNTFSRPNSTFSGWSDGSRLFNPGDSYGVSTSDIVLTAQWNATITPETPFLTDLNSTVGAIFTVNVLGVDGSLIPVIVEVPAGTVDINGRIRIVIGSTPAQNSLGQISLSIQILDTFGNVIPQINNTMVLHFRNPVGTTIVAESSDGFIWRAIPLIPNGGTTIAAGQVDGYYLDALGNVVIVTSHLTYFGFKKAQTTKFNASVTPLRITPKTNAQIRSSGGSGVGRIRFFSSTPQICSVSARGVVKALSGGSCKLVAIKGGDMLYLSQSSALLTLAVSGPSIIAFGTGTLRQITVNLGSGYGGKSASIQFAPMGTAHYSPVASAKLSSLGKIVISGNVPNGSVLRVLVAGKTIASFGVPGK